MDGDDKLNGASVWMSCGKVLCGVLWSNSVANLSFGDVPARGKVSLKSDIRVPPESKYNFLYLPKASSVGVCK